MDFSALILSQYVDADSSREADEWVMQAAVDQALFAGELGFNPWSTEHHFRGPWQSLPIQFASYIAPQLAEGRYFGFGVVSVPYHHPVRLVEQMNMLDQFMKGRTLFGMGSGYGGIESPAVGLDRDYHRSGQAARDGMDVMERLWDYSWGDEPYEFDTGQWRGRVVKRVVPSAYRHRRPTIIRTASSEAATLLNAQHGYSIFLGRGGDVAEQIRLYRRALEDAGHPPEVIDECLRWTTTEWRDVVIAESESEIPGLIEEARQERIRLREQFLAHSPGPVWGAASGAGQATNRQLAEEGEHDNPTVGTPEMIAEELSSLQRQGTGHLLLRFLGQWQGDTKWIAEQSMRLFSEQVLPDFSDIKQPQLADGAA